MTKQDVERIINKTYNKILMGFVFLVVVLTAINFYYDQQLLPMIVVMYAVLISLIFSFGMLKSVLIDLFAALENERKEDKPPL